MKKKIKYITEIICAACLIFVSYFVWDRIDVLAYDNYINTFNTNNVVMEIEDGFETLSYLSDENTSNTKVYLNNYQDKVFNVNLILELNGINDDIMNNLYLVNNNKTIKLKDLYISNEDDYYRFLVTNLNLNEYEKTNIILKLLVEDDYIFSNNQTFSYNILNEIL